MNSAISNDKVSDAEDGISERIPTSTNRINTTKLVLLNN